MHKNGGQGDGGRRRRTKSFYSILRGALLRYRDPGRSYKGNKDKVAPRAKSEFRSVEKLPRRYAVIKRHARLLFGMISRSARAVARGYRIPQVHRLPPILSVSSAVPVISFPSLPFRCRSKRRSPSIPGVSQTGA